MADDRETRAPIIVEHISYLPKCPPAAEEIERRRRAVDEMLKLRESIGTIDLTVQELLAEDDEADD